MVNLVPFEPCKIRWRYIMAKPQKNEQTFYGIGKYCYFTYYWYPHKHSTYISNPNIVLCIKTRTSNINKLYKSVVMKYAQNLIYIVYK